MLTNRIREDVSLNKFLSLEILELSSIFLHLPVTLFYLAVPCIVALAIELLLAVSLICFALVGSDSILLSINC